MNKPSFSFEIFPPRKSDSIDKIYKVLEELKDLNPDFISVTFGAGGSANSSNRISKLSSGKIPHTKHSALTLHTLK